MNHAYSVTAWNLDLITRTEIKRHNGALLAILANCPMINQHEHLNLVKYFSLSLIENCSSNTRLVIKGYISKTSF